MLSTKIPHPRFLPLIGVTASKPGPSIGIDYKTVYASYTGTFRILLGTLLFTLAISTVLGQSGDAYSMKVLPQ